jgi:hypothetical protein
MKQNISVIIVMLKNFKLFTVASIKSSTIMNFGKITNIPNHMMTFLA